MVQDIFAPKVTKLSLSAQSGEASLNNKVARI